MISAAILERIYNFLYRRPHSRHEIESYLKGRLGLNENDTAELIDRLTKDSFVNDESFTRWLIEYNLRRSSTNTQKLRLKIAQKGIPKDTSNRILLEYSDKISKKEQESVKLEVEKQERKLSSLPKGKREQMILQRLAFRGFQLRDIRSYLRE
jgi:SOS response regulatory protein OraA/RecX